MTTLQETGAQTYNRPISNTTASVTLVKEYRLATPSTGKTIRIQEFQSHDPTAVAQVDTATVSLGTTGDFYVLEVEDGTTAASYAAIQEATDTAATLAAKFAAAIDAHPGIRAKASGAVITLTGVIPGTAIAYDETSSTTPGNLALANTTAASGTPNHGMISDVELEYALSVSGGVAYPQIKVTADFKDGDPTTPESVSSPINLTATGSRSIDQIQTDNGVPRT